MKTYLAKFSIQAKLFTALGFGFVGFLIYFAANFSILSKNQDLMKRMVEEHLPKLESSEKLAQALSGVKAAMVEAAFSGSMDGIANLETAHQRAQVAINNLKEAGGSGSELDDKIEKYQETYKMASELLQNVVAGLEQLSGVQGKLQKGATDIAAFEAWATELKDKQVAEFRASTDSANSGTRRAIVAGWLLVLCGIPFGFILYFVTKNVTFGLEGVSHQLAEVSRNMAKISSDTSSASSKLATASAQQATAVTESVSSMEQMKTKLGQTVRHSGDALKASEDSYREASDGMVVINNLKDAMYDIERSYEQLEEVKQVVHMIGEKTNVINDIVFKTQLLSFNASIEAARAGQHGRGFAVVAAEVGKLAEMSGKAAQEIGRLLEQSSFKVAEIVESTKSKVGAANQMSQKCATVFERINERAGQVKSVVTAISSAASEQESDIHMVGRAMDEMNESAGETDKMAHSIAELSSVLRGHSSSLATSVETLDALVHGLSADLIAPKGGGSLSSGSSKASRPMKLAS